MRRHTNASWQEFGASGGDHEGLLTVFQAESELVNMTEHRTILHFRLGHGRLKIHIPHCRCLAAVNVSLLVQVYKAHLRDLPAPIVDRRVFLVPVHSKPNASPECFERLLVLRRQLEAKLDEIPP